MVNSSSEVKFGIAFCEISGPCLIRTEGNDEELKSIAIKNADALAAGIFLNDFTCILWY